MPRMPSEQNEAGRVRTELWRQRRRNQRRPEASLVDRAIAASFAAFFVRDLDTNICHGDYHAIILGARRILMSQGYAKVASNNELMRRLTRRSDLSVLSEISGASAAAE